MGNPGRLCSGTPLPRAQEEGGPGGARISCRLHHQSLRVDSEKSIWFINTNTLGVSLGTANWMGVHGSQGRCLSPPVPSSVLLLAALGLDEAGLGGGARGANEITSRKALLLGCGLPAARPGRQRPACRSQVYGRLTMCRCGQHSSLVWTRLSRPQMGT